MMKRDEAWLQYLLDDIWDNSFADIRQDNIVRIEFGRKAKRRLGSIRLDPIDLETSIITINSIFKDPEVPEMVIRATIVHELSHYAHGFNSPRARNKAQPHAGGVIRREYAERGLLQLYLDQKKWLKHHWPGIVAKQLKPQQKRIIVAKKTTKIPKPFWFIG